MNLAKKKCIPCEKGTKSFNATQIEEHLGQAQGWKVKDGREIQREFKFANFKDAQDFVLRVGTVAETEGHHPDIEFGWGYAKIKLWTHSINGLSENDFIMAAKINLLEDSN